MVENSKYPVFCFWAKSGSGQPLRSAMNFFYLSNEGLRIIENFGDLRALIPQRLKHVVVELREEQE